MKKRLEPTTEQKTRVSKQKREQRTFEKSNKKIQHVRVVSTQSPKGFDKVLHFFVTTLFCFLRYFFVFLFGAIVSLAIVVLVLAFMYIRIISNSSDVPISRLFSIGLKSRNERLFTPDERYTVLVLGTDALANRDEESKLTDTIMVVSADPNRGRIDTFSVPRDFWIASQSSKINGLYSKDKNSTLSIVSTITGVPIQKQVVIDIATVGKLIDAIGGLDVVIERSFVDYRFPRSDVDVRVERNVDKLYETVAFTKGVEHMSGDRALKYIRSRHSPDVIEGTDDARVKRQQQVISSLLSKIKDPLLLRNPEQIGAMIYIFEHETQSTLSLEDMATIGWQFVNKKTFPKFVPHQFTSKEVDKNGVLTHPDRFPGGAWVYLPADPTYAQIQDLVAQWLKE